MDAMMAGLTPAVFVTCLLITAFAGFVKGSVGFAMPMIMISGMASFLAPHEALAALILPTLATNAHQALRQGWTAFIATVRDFRRYLVVTAVFLVISAQFVDVIPQGVFLMALGLPITVFALVRLSGQSLALRLEHRGRAEVGSAVVGGLYGGVSGVWGPPLLVYLMSVGADKETTVRVQGVVFLIGALVLLAAHLQSGVLNAATLPFSAVLVVPAMIGLGLGYVLQDRLDQARFGFWTQVLLVLTGVNLMRRALGM
jgi:uncharacterized protein